MKKTMLLITVLLAGCSAKTHNFFKAMEEKAYDSASNMVSEYCANKYYLVSNQVRIHDRRQIRQRGYAGPSGPVVKPESLDDETAFGNGPIIRIWCKREDVPEEVWKDLVKEQ